MDIRVERNHFSSLYNDIFLQVSPQLSMLGLFQGPQRSCFIEFKHFKKNKKKENNKKKETNNNLIIKKAK